MEGVCGVNLTVHSGEIVALQGSLANGLRECGSFGGAASSTGGQVLINGEIYTATRAEMYKHRTFVLPEEPLRNAAWLT
jgi:simple sugar transport system ATP-binding protein